jgi:hypothetical protein
MPDPDVEPERAWQRTFGTLRNLAAHYDVPLGLRVENWGAGQAPWLAGLKLQVLLLGAGSGDTLTVARELAAGPLAVGVPVPVNGDAGTDAIIGAVSAARAAGGRLFLSTAAAVGGQGDLAALRGLAARLRAAT